ncbi:MAG TPA: SPOR domain-containing protein [Devosia sp.]|nr:SPOR domain-containing protein [Devosia sp.]
MAAIAPAVPASHSTGSSSILPVVPAPPIASRRPAQPLNVATASPVQPTEAPTQLIPPTPAPLAGSAPVRAAIPVPADPNRPLDVIGAWLSNTFDRNAAPNSLAYSGTPPAPIPPAEIGSPSQAIDLMTAGAISDAPAPAAATGPGWIIQIGAPPSTRAARSLLDEATRNVSALRNFRPYVERFEKTGQVFYRARFAGFAVRDDAVSICEKIRQTNLSCLAVQG